MDGFVNEWVIKALQIVIRWYSLICSHLLECHKFVLCNCTPVDFIFIPNGGRQKEYLFRQVTNGGDFSLLE